MDIKLKIFIIAQEVKYVCINLAKHNLYAENYTMLIKEISE